MSVYCDNHKDRLHVAQIAGTVFIQAMDDMSMEFTPEKAREIAAALKCAADMAASHRLEGKL